MAELEECKKMLTELIQMQMVVLGPNIALDKARKIAGINVSTEGLVVSIEGDAQMVLKGVANEYVALSGQIAQMALNKLLVKYPTLKGI